MQSVISKNVIRAVTVCLQLYVKIVFHSFYRDLTWCSYSTGMSFSYLLTWHQSVVNDLVELFFVVVRHCGFPLLNMVYFCIKNFIKQFCQLAFSCEFLLLETVDLKLNYGVFIIIVYMVLKRTVFIISVGFMTIYG